jgi:magnesium chelatase subunit D
MVPLYPFSAIVGQLDLRRALVLNAVRPDIGGVLIRGERGTAKSTAARALAALLPAIRVMVDCRFACDPAASPEAWCDDCRARHAAAGNPPAAERRTPFVDLPVGATEDRVVGTLDIRRVLATGERHFEPGLLAAANRGVLYVDEVNLLDDHVVDVLLDAAAMGVNIVEREGVSFSHPARFILIGTMNPEEGDLRPQLTDRFGLAVDIRAAAAIDDRVEILRRRLAFDADPAGFNSLWAVPETDLRQAIVAARERLPRIGLPDGALRVAAELVAAVGVDGHRAELAILKAAQANAAFEGREVVGMDDLALAARLALRHRLRRGPFESEGSDLSLIDAVLERFGQGQGWDDDAQGGAHPAAGPPDAGGRESAGDRPGADNPGGVPTDASGGTPRPGRVAPDEGTAERPVASGESFEVRRLDTTLDRLSRRPSGRRSLTHTDTRRGRYVRARPAGDQLDDIAFDASLRVAAIRQAPLAPGTAVQIAVDDLQRKVRVRKAGHLILFMVDASWSMATAERLAAAKGAVLSLLVDAYQRRDRVALAVFRRQGTRVVLPFTASVSLARERLREIAVGGKTPLSHALHTADRLFERERLRDPSALPLLVLLTDGAGNISLSGRSPAEEARLLAERLRQRGVQSLVIDLYSRSYASGPSPAAELAAHLGGEISTVDALRAEGVVARVRERLGEG